MITRKNIIYTGITILSFVLISYFIFGKNNGSNGRPGNAAAVRYIVVKPELINVSDEVPGRVVSYQTAEIRPQVSGIIQSRLFEEGSFVDEGQQLYQIDPASYEADYQIAEANLQDTEASLKNAENLLGRYQKLIDINAVSKLEYDNAESSLNQAKAKVSQAKAEVRNAKINLDYTKVYAPISGYVGPSAVTKGALVTAQQDSPLAIVRQLDPVYVDLSQAVEEVKKLQERMMLSRLQEDQKKEYKVSLFVGNSDTPYPEKGILDATDLAVDVQTGSIRLRSVFPNPKTALLPGMFVRAIIDDLGSDTEMILPQKAVQIMPDGKMSVWKVNDKNKVLKQIVEVGEAYNHNWVITKGLKEGDKVVIEGFMSLSEGQDVNPQNQSSGKS